MSAVLLLLEPQPGLSRGHVPSFWKDHLFYVFPPIPLIHRVLLEVRREGASVILIALAWPCEHWFTTLLDLSVESPIRLPLAPDLITQDHSGLRYPNLEF